MNLKELKNFIDEATNYYGGDTPITLFDEQGNKLRWPLELSRRNPSDEKSRLLLPSKHKNKLKEII